MRVQTHLESHTLCRRFRVCRCHSDVTCVVCVCAAILRLLSTHCLCCVQKCRQNVVIHMFNINASDRCIGLQLLSLDVTPCGRVLSPERSLKFTQRCSGRVAEAEWPRVSHTLCCRLYVLFVCAACMCRTELQSFLIEITALILAKKDDLTR
jgi:hypothetical protein